MRVAFLAWRDLANPNAGGSEVVVDRLIRGLRDRGHEAELICAAPVGERPYPVHPTGGRLGTYTQYLTAPATTWRHGPYDLVVDVANGMSYFAPWWRRAPSLLLVHHVQGEMWHHYYFPEPVAAAGELLEGRVAPIAYRHTKVVAVSESTRDVLVGLGFPRRNIEVVHNGIDEHCFVPEAAEAPEPTFVALGRLAPHKDFDRLLDLWDRVRREVGGRLVIVGDGPERARLEARGVAGVEFTGFVDEDEKVARLAESWLLVHSAHQEGWGLVVMEAAAAGTPTLAFDVPGIRDSVVDGVTGVRAEDEDRFVKEWIDLARDPERRHRLGRAARARADDFGWDATVDRFCEVAEAVVAAGRPPARPRRRTGGRPVPTPAPDPATTVRTAEAPAAGPSGPLDPAEVPDGLRRMARLFGLFRREQTDPDAFYRFLAADTIRQLERWTSLEGTLALDIGGGAGYMAEALRARGADCLLLEYDHAELHLHGRTPDRAVRGDAQQLPVASDAVGLVHSSNVLEHVPDPEAMLAEMARVLAPGRGLAYLSFPNWYGPWGGHETAPWHYLGGDLARRRYVRRHGAAPKNEFGTSMYAVHIGPVLRWFRSRPDLEVLWVGPRYYPRWARPIVAVPGVRELVTWNLLVIFRRRY